ncbi:NucA/NucB deoxyribonuclease domain-containing protein [Spirillospora sp. CA-108201]
MRGRRRLHRNPGRRRAPDTADGHHSDQQEPLRGLQDCPSPRPTGEECDEYPFAATHQGAALHGKGDFNWELVKDTDNSTEGGYRS